MIETKKATETEAATSALTASASPPPVVDDAPLPPLPEAMRTRIRTGVAGGPPVATPPENVPSPADDAVRVDGAAVVMASGIKRRLQEQVARLQGAAALSPKRAIATLRARGGELAASRPAWMSVGAFTLPQISPELRDGLVKQGRRAGLNIGTALDKIVRQTPKVAAPAAHPISEAIAVEQDISTVAVQRAVKQPSIFAPSHILTALLTGGIIHIATTFAVTSLGTGSAFRQLRPVLPPNEVVVLPAQTAGAQLLPFLAPDMLYALCRFDLKSGPVEINAVLPEVGWSLALYTRQGDNFYAAPGQSQRPVPVVFMLSQATDRLVNMTPGVRKADVDISQVTSPDAEGLMVVRAPLKGVAYEASAKADLKRASCAPSRR